jgi:ParB-like chromosome segregation protein Spo0J
MFKLPVRIWILNAAAVFSGQHGAVTRQAEQFGYSRETVYEHAQKVERRLADESAADVAAQLRAENQRLHEAITKLRRESQGRILLDKDRQRQFATTACAMGVSLRQVEDLLGVFLPRDQVPDHSTLGRWVADEAERAGEVLKALDPACVGRVETLAIDEIFFGGGRPWSGSNRRA